MQVLLAKCSERCGWVGAVRTGWVRVSEAWVARSGAPEASIRRRGDEVQHRRRLRDIACPGCGVVGLDRAVKLLGAAQEHA